LFFPILFAAIAVVNAEYREARKTSTKGGEIFRKACRHISLCGAALCSFPERINSAFALYSVGE
jgi:hypothetical protein